MYRLAIPYVKTRSLEFFSDGSHLVSIGGRGLSVYVWNLQEKKLVQKIPLNDWATHLNLSYYLENIALIGNRIVVQGGMQQLFVCPWPEIEDIHILQFDDQIPIWIRPLKNHQGVLCHFSGSRMFQILDYDEENVERFESVKSPLLSPSMFLADVSADRQWIVTSLLSRIQVTHCECETECVAEKYINYYLKSAEFSPDGQRFVVVYSRFVRVFETKGANACCLPIRHHRKVQHAKFAPDGRLLTTTVDGQVHVWDRHDYHHLTTYDFQLNHLRAFSISQDGLMVAIGGDTPEIIVFDLDN